MKRREFITITPRGGCSFKIYDASENKSRFSIKGETILPARLGILCSAIVQFPLVHCQVGPPIIFLFRAEDSRIYSAGVVADISSSTASPVGCSCTVIVSSFGASAGASAASSVSSFEVSAESSV